jgi:hypothetical protein
VVSRGDYAALANSCSNLLSDSFRREQFSARGPAVAASLFDAGINASGYRALLEAVINTR